MSLPVQSSFAAGELDPALHERTNLEKYHSGLATARNMIIGKSGRLVSRPGRKHFKKAKLNNSKIKIHPLSYNHSFLEWGDEYVRHWRVNPEFSDIELLGDFTHDFTEDDLEHIQFVDVAVGRVLILLYGDVVKELVVGATFAYDTGFTTAADIFVVPAAPAFVFNTVTGGDYDVDYAISMVYDGEEGSIVETSTGKFPVNAGDKCVIIVDCGVAATVSAHVQEIRVYRRPRGAGAYGYVGSSTAFATVDTKLQATFTDVGVMADYAHNPPTFNQAMRDLGFTDPTDLHSQTGCMYQQRLLLSYKDQIYTSRTGFPRNFTRDYPLAADSSLAFKMGTKGNVNIIYLVDSDGLVAFTYDGIYLHTGVLSPTNLAMVKKGPWVIDPTVPPIAIPGGVLFIDSLTNVVRQLLWSQEAGTYLAEEMSIFSNHLFEKVTVKSWAFQDGAFPLLWVIYSDGSYATFTYEREHQMRAWTRHDSGFGIEYVATTTKGAMVDTGVIYPTDGEIIFVTNVDGQRYIELGIPRYAKPSELSTNPEADKGPSIAALDSMVTWQYIVNREKSHSATADLTLSLVPVTPDDWEGDLRLHSSGAIFDGAEDYSDGVILAVGDIFRHFNPDDGTEVDLEITEIVGNSDCVVKPSAEFPSDYADDVKLYLTKNVLTKQVDYRSAALGGWPTSLNGYLGGQIFTVTPDVAGVWDGILTIDSGSAAVFTGAHDVRVGGLLYYKTTAGVWIELVITEITDNKHIKVQPDQQFPETEASDITLNLRIRFPFSLDHLEGEDVAIVADGYVLASPNNNVENYPTCTVTDGELTLPGDYRAAIVHVGRPYTMDIQTLDIDTTEQHPVLLESITVNKVYIKVLNSRGFYVGSRFPADDGVKGMTKSGVEEITMEDSEKTSVADDINGPLLGNRYPAPRSGRLELTLPGDWKSQGRICLRQVDPVHFEILSIIPDLEELVRSRL